jgi:hypothetical protein
VSARGGVAAVHALTLDRSPLVRMVAIIAVLFAGMKAVVVAEWAACGVSLPPLRLLAFTTLWPGMRPHVFARFEASRPGGRAMILRGLARVAAGLALVLGARVVFAHTRSLALATVVLLPALSLTLHFGVFGVLAGLWRCAGASTARLFRNPLRSRSLAEFWSERWNLAFSEMTAVAVYRPVAAGLGRNAGLLAAFVASGLAHEAAISLPVRAGYGLPLLYFVLHGVLVLVEQRWDPPLAWARLWTLGTLALPLPLLFHPPFLRGIVWPFLA